MTTEYGQRLLIDCDSSDQSTATSTSEEEDNDKLMADIERAFGNSYQQQPPNNYLHSRNNIRSIHTIRFQVVIWNIGKLDVATGSVPMLFRVSLFWNDLPVNVNSGGKNRESNAFNKRSSHSTTKPRIVSYNLQGRSKATPCRVDSSNTTTEQEDLTAIDIPPLSILNVSTFTIIGSPEVDLLDPSSKLLRWTCMYRATVMQEQLRVDQFPHDCHTIRLELAILTHRRAGQRWDRRFWKLQLATEDDVQISRKALRVPYGLVVDHVRIPEFHYRPSLQFQFCSQQDGSFDNRRSSFCAIPDVTLQVQLMVLRESGYYDRNIVPLLAFLNVIAATLTLVLDAEKFFYRGLLILNIAFNQMGVRLAVDKHLPSVGYEIRLQRILNEFFFVLLALILEAALVYGLATNEICGDKLLEWVDGVTAAGALGHNAYTIASYYAARTKARRMYQQGISDDTHEIGWFGRQPQIV